MGIVMRKAGAETDEIPETVPEIKKEKDIVPEGRTVLSNSSEQTVSMVMRKALVQTDEIAENDIGPDGWKGTWDMPEAVRQACTTGSTCHQYKSQQEVKDVPEGGSASMDKDDQPVVMTNYLESDALVNKGGTDMEFDDHSYSNFEEKVCKELNENT